MRLWVNGEGENESGETLYVRIDGEEECERYA